MAYRRRQQGISRPSSTFEGIPDEGIKNPPSPSSSSSSFESSVNDIDSSFPSSPSSLAAKAIRASSARRDSSLSSVYGHSNLSNASLNTIPTITTPPYKDSRTHEYSSIKSLNESKHGFWGVLARKAKSILDDDNLDQQSKTSERIGSQMLGAAYRAKFSNSNHLEESNIKRDSPTLLKGLDAITSSLNHIGGTIGNALEEGFTIMENRTLDIIQETRKHIKKKPGNSEGQRQETNPSATWQQSQLWTQMQTDQELQLKASRDVRWQLCITFSCGCNGNGCQSKTASSGVEDCQS